jgi:hypothetical protein
MGPSLKDIDARIASLSAEVDATGSSLAELDGDLTLKLLASASLSGRTAAEWAAVAPKIPLLWGYFGALKDKLAEIVADRGTRPRLKDEELNRLAAGLFANSVALSPDPTTAVRTLTGPGVQMASVAWIQATMAKLFQEIVSLVDRVGKAWSALPRLDTLDATLTGVVQSAGQSGVKVPAEVAAARIAVANLRAQVKADPLAADVSGVDALARQVDAAGEALRGAVAARAGLADRLSAAAETLDATGALIDQARAAQAATAEKIAGPATRADDVQALAGRLARLRASLADAASLAQSSWQEASRVLGQLEPQAATLRDDATTGLQTARGPLDARNELRGRLDAYHAKALAIGMAENEALSAIYERAKTLLYNAPCDVAQAEALVRSYQQGLTHTGSVPETSR